MHFTYIRLSWLLHVHLMSHRLLWKPLVHIWVCTAHKMLEERNGLCFTFILLNHFHSVIFSSHRDLEDCSFCFVSSFEGAFAILIQLKIDLTIFHIECLKKNCGAIFLSFFLPAFASVWHIWIRHHVLNVECIRIYYTTTLIYIINAIMVPKNFSNKCDDYVKMYHMIRRCDVTSYVCDTSVCGPAYKRTISSILCLMRCETFISISICIHATIPYISTVSHVCIVGLMTAIQNNIIRFIAIKLELFNYDFPWGFYGYPVECVCLHISEIDSKQIQKHKATMTIANTDEIQFNIFCPLSGVNQQIFFWRNGFVCRLSEMYKYAMWEMICLEMAFKQKFKCARQLLNETNRHCQFEIILNTQFSFRIRQHTRTHARYPNNLADVSWSFSCISSFSFLFFYGLSFCKHIKNEEEEEEGKKQQNKHNQKFHSFNFDRCDQIYYYYCVCVIDRHGIATAVFCLSWHSTRITESDTVFVRPKADKCIDGNNDHFYISPLIAYMHMKITEYSTNRKHSTEI